MLKAAFIVLFRYIVLEICRNTLGKLTNVIQSVSGITSSKFAELVHCYQDVIGLVIFFVLLIIVFYYNYELCSFIGACMAIRALCGYRRCC